MEDNSNHNPPLAYENKAFLTSDDGRPLRIVAEYLEPLHRWTVFNNIRSAAAVFGFLLILIANALTDSGV